MKNKRPIITALLITAGIFYSFFYFYFVPSQDFIRRYPINVGSFQSTGSYKINPETILASLARGETDVFLLEQEPPESPTVNTPVAWSQEAYQNIADVFHKFLWKETLDGWNLYRMSFHAKCQDKPSGFDYADFIYFREVSVDGKRLYTAREIFITPQYEDISWGSDTNFPRPAFGWNSIDLDQVRVTAEEALIRAEERGGKAARLSVQNQCHIYVSMNPEGYHYDDWRVGYGGNSNLSNGDILIPKSD